MRAPEFLVSGNFKRLAGGQWAFFPWSHLGRGYVLPAGEAGRRFRRRFAWSTVAMSAVLLFVVFTYGYLATFAGAVLLGAVHLLWQRRFVRGLPLSPERLSYREVMAGARWLFWLLVLVAAGGLVVTARVAHLVPEVGWVSLIPAAVAASILVYAALMLRWTRTART